MNRATINPETFREAFGRFQALISARTGHPFKGFDEGLAAVWESSKPRLRDHALGLLHAGDWSEDEIGSGAILNRTIAAIEIPKSGINDANNLVPWSNRWGHANRDHRALLEAVSNPKQRQAFDQALFGLFRSTADERVAFGQRSLAAADRAAGRWSKIGFPFRRAGTSGEIHPFRHFLAAFHPSATRGPGPFLAFRRLGHSGRAVRHRRGLSVLWSRSFARENRTGDQHDAFSIAAWFSRADRDGSLAGFLKPDLSPPERTVAQVEGWILGVPGLIRAGKGRDDSPSSAACDPSVFRLH